MGFDSRRLHLKRERGFLKSKKDTDNQKIVGVFLVYSGRKGPGARPAGENPPARCRKMLIVWQISSPSYPRKVGGLDGDTV